MGERIRGLALPTMGGVVELLAAAALIIGCITLLATPYYAFAVIPGLLIIGLLVFGRHPELAFYLLVLLLPFEDIIRVSSKYEFLTLTKFLGMWIVVVVAFTVILNKRFLWNIRSSFWGLLALFVLSNVVAASFSDYQATAFNEVRKILVACLFFMLSLIFVNRRAFTRTIPLVLIAGVTVNFLLFVWEYVLALPLIPGGELFPKSSSPTEVLPSAFVVMMLFSTPFLAYHFFRKTSLLHRAFVLAIVAINVFGVVYFKSRAGTLVMVIICLLVLWEYRKNIKPRHLGFLLSLGCIGALLLAGLAPSSYWERQKRVVQPKVDASISRRVTYNIVGWELFRNNPILGVGPGTFSEYYGRSAYAPVFEEEKGMLPRRAHNTYLEVLTGSGLPSLLLFVLIIVQGFRNYARARRLFAEREDDDMRFLTGAYRMGFVAYVITFVFISYAHSKLFWLSLACSQVALKFAIEDAQSADAETEVSG